MDAVLRKPPWTQHVYDFPELDRPTAWVQRRYGSAAAATYFALRAWHGQRAEFALGVVREHVGKPFLATLELRRRREPGVPDPGKTNRYVVGRLALRRLRAHERKLRECAARKGSVRE